MNMKQPPDGTQRAGCGQILEVDAETVRAWVEAGDCVLVDVREDHEHSVERIEGALRAPLSRLEATALALPADKRTVFFCRSGNRTRVHAPRLVACAGRDAYALAGGLIAWKALGFPIDFD